MAVIYSLALPNIYQSKTILSPVGPSNASGVSSVMKSVGGLASLAGVNMSSNNEGNNAMKALEKLNTLSFFENSILPNIFLPDLWRSIIGMPQHENLFMMTAFMMKLQKLDKRFSASTTKYQAHRKVIIFLFNISESQRT